MSREARDPRMRSDRPSHGLPAVLAPTRIVRSNSKDFICFLLVEILVLFLYLKATNLNIMSGTVTSINPTLADNNDPEAHGLLIALS